MSLTKATFSMIDGAPVNVLDYGAVGDGVTDDSAAVQAAADYCVANSMSLYAPAGYTIYLDSAVDLRSIRYIDFGADILVNPAIVGVPVTVGGFAQSSGGRWRFNSVSDGASVILGPPPARPVFRVYGSKAFQIELGSCQYFQIYSNAAVTSGNSNAYNQIYLNGAVLKMELFGDTGFSWINENFVYGGRIAQLIIDGTNYPHNHNKFFNNTFEGAAVDVQFLGGAHVNTIYGARFENTGSSAGILFSADSYSNYVITSWSGTGNPRTQFENYPLVSDSGEGNLVTTEASYLFSRELLFDVSPASKIVANSTSSAALAMSVGRSAHQNTPVAVFNPSLRGFSVAAFRVIALSDYIPVELGDCFGFSADYEGDLLRSAIYVYDADMKPIISEGSGGAYISQAGTAFGVVDGRGGYGQSVNVSAQALTQRVAAVVRPEVKYVQVAVTSGNVAAFVRSVQAVSWTRPIKGIKMTGASAMLTGPTALNGAPTRGFVPYGSQVLDISTSPATLRYVSYEYETFVNGALSAGATSVTVVDPESIANGDIVGILLDDETTHWTTVSALSGSTFTIAAIPAGRSVADQSRITFNRWAA